MSKLRCARRLGSLAAVLVVTLLVSAPIGAGAQEEGPGSGTDATEAVYGDRVIDMAKDWEGAKACLVWPAAVGTPECFDTEEDMDRRIAELEKMTGTTPSPVAKSGGGAESDTSCSGYLRLYDGTSYTGAALYLRGRFEWFDLATFNFNQKTSSFKIGPCSAYLADLAGGGGAWYPTAQTQAYDVAPTMATGWNNDVSSVYIT